MIQNGIQAQTYFDVDNNKIDKVIFDKLLAGKEYYPGRKRFFESF